MGQNSRPKLRDGSEWGDCGEVLFGPASVLGIHSRDSDEGAMVYVVKDSDESNERDCDAYASDVLALLDANGLNTTANELRKELEETREKLRAVELLVDEMAKKAAALATRAAYLSKRSTLRREFHEMYGAAYVTSLEIWKALKT